MNPLKKVSFFFTRKIKPGFSLRKTDIVLDIGSGDKPFWRANVFLDKLALKNLHRHTDTKTVRDLGPFIDCDINKTPFKDKAFDFSFCAHLLEHVERPDLAIKEISRISKKGYIEVPNGVIEHISPFHSHIWFIFLVKKKLVFYRKSEALHKTLMENSKSYYKLIEKIEEPFIRYYWVGKIDFEIIDDGKKFKKFNPPNKTPKTRKNTFFLQISAVTYIWLIKSLRYLYRVDSNQAIKELFK